MSRSILSLVNNRMDTTHELKQGDSITITAASGKTPIAFTHAQVLELQKAASLINQFDGGMAGLLSVAAEDNPGEQWSNQDVDKCAASGCIVGARYLEYYAYSMLDDAKMIYGFPTWYVGSLRINMFGEQDGCWNWQLDESKIYDWLTWPDLDREIVNHYNTSRQPNWIDGKQYREWRRLDGTDGDVINAANGMRSSVMCLRDSNNPDAGTHTSVCVLYRATDGEYWHVMLDTAFGEYNGGILLASEEEHDKARNSNDVYVRSTAALFDRRFGPGKPRYLHNAYTHVAALSVLMRSFAESVI